MMNAMSSIRWLNIITTIISHTIVCSSWKGHMRNQLTTRKRLIRTFSFVWLVVIWWSNVCVMITLKSRKSHQRLCCDWATSCSFYASCWSIKLARRDIDVRIETNKQTDMVSKISRWFDVFVWYVRFIQFIIQTISYLLTLFAYLSIYLSAYWSLYVLSFHLYQSCQAFWTSWLVTQLTRPLHMIQLFHKQLMMQPQQLNRWHIHQLELV